MIPVRQRSDCADVKAAVIKIEHIFLLTERRVVPVQNTPPDGAHAPVRADLQNTYMGPAAKATDHLRGDGLTGRVILRVILDPERIALVVPIQDRTDLFL